MSVRIHFKGIAQISDERYDWNPPTENEQTWDVSKFNLVTTLIYLNQDERTKVFYICSLILKGQQNYPKDILLSQSQLEQLSSLLDSSDTTLTVNLYTEEELSFIKKVSPTFLNNERLPKLYKNVYFHQNQQNTTSNFSFSNIEISTGRFTDKIIDINNKISNQL